MFRPRSRPARSVASGNIITIALHLYRLTGNRSFLTSLIAHAWFSLIGVGIFVGVLILAIVATIFIAASDGNWGVIIFMVAVGLGLGLPLFAFGLARFTASGGLLSRQFFNALQSQEEPESEARAKVYPRMWIYLWSILGVTGLLFLVYLVWAAFGYILYLVLTPLLSSLDWENMSQAWETVLITAVTLFILGLLLLAMVVISYFTARLSLVDAILAIEPEQSWAQAIQRSWQLTQNQAWHTLTVFFVASILVIPANLAAGIVNAVIIIPVAGFFASVLLFPLWQGIKSVMYYDLRVRNEGLSFTTADQSLSPMRFLRRVNVQTPESIELDFALAGIGSRALAWVIDQIILYVGLVLLAIATAYLYFYGLYPVIIERFPDSEETFNLWALGIYLLINFFIYNGYFIYFEAAWQGQTPGKRFSEIRVVQDNGKPIGIKEAALRSFLQVIDIGFFGIGVFLTALTASEKRVGDLAAGTLVIQDEQATRTAPTVQSTSPKAEQIAELLQTWPGLGRITPEQYLLVRNFLLNRQQLSPGGRFRTSQSLRRSLEDVFSGLDIPPDLSEVTAEEFLEAIYQAYRQR